MDGVAVIGSGPSGLVAAKSVAEHGLEPVVFESAGAVGGMWGGPGRGAWSSSARTNLSYFSCAFSDFPWPDGSAVFPVRENIVTYLEDYATEFGLREHIKFGQCVESIRPAGRHQWQINYRTDGRAESAVFYDVIIATGIFSATFIPNFPGLADYRGSVHHAAECDSIEGIRERFAGKRVLVVGAAFSGTEIACLMTDCAASVTVAFRHPMWFVPRWIPAEPGGSRYPLDLVVYSRRGDNPMIRTPRQFLREIGGDPGDISPELAFDRDSEPPLTIVITDEFPAQVRSGAVAVKRTAELGFDASGALFSDGSRLDVDAVVMCTGYTTRLPFFDDDVLRTISFDPHEQFLPTLLHRHVFHPDLPGVAFVGHYRGPYFPVMELQARWVARVFAGELSPPSKAEMLDGIEDERRLRAQKPRPQFPHGDFVGLADGLAREVGVYPELGETHPLRQHIARGPVVPAHYRLVGPQAKPELAQGAILATPSPLLDQRTRRGTNHG
jgi:dimethylaniline monooxygenase (N-oxide forming)